MDGHNVSGQFDAEFHGFDGFIGVSVPGAGRAIDGQVMETTEELDEFPFRLDWNSGTLRLTITVSYAEYYYGRRR